MVKESPEKFGSSKLIENIYLITSTEEPKMEN